MAIENARLHVRVQELALLEDRERIARDLHDTVVQRLFATGLSLQGTARLVDRPEVAERISQAVDDLDLTVKHIRTAIFGLETSRRPRGGLRQRALALTSDSAGSLGFDPHVVFDGPVDTVPDDVAAELLPVLREALANVARHASASQVDVEITADRDVVLRVTDNGRGLPEERRPGGRGMLNMQARASRLGGAMLARAAVPGSGTALEWRAPISSP